MESIVENKDNDELQIGNCSDFKPGQKFATPSPGSGDRSSVFYETLLQQNPASEMAQDWCLAYGILESDAAMNLYKTVCKRKGKPVNVSKVTASPVKPPVKKELSNKKSSVKESNTVVEKPKKKAKIIDEITDTGFDSSSGWEEKGAIRI